MHLSGLFSGGHLPTSNVTDRDLEPAYPRFPRHFWVHWNLVFRTSTIVSQEWYLGRKLVKNIKCQAPSMENVLLQ